MQRLICFAATAWLLTSPVLAQRIQFPAPVGTGVQPAQYVAPAYTPPAAQPYGAVPGYTAPMQPYTGAPQPYGGVPQPYAGAAAPPNGLINVPPANGASTVVQPGFDPYSARPNAASVPPALPADPNLAPYGAAAPYAVPGAGAVLGTPAAPYPPGGYPPGAYPPGAPNSMFPNGFGTNPIQPAPWGPPLRLLYGPRFRYSWVAPEDEADSLGINDFDLSVAFSFPNFFGSGQPIFIIPSFSLHLWDGPKPPNTSDLPSRAYSGFLDFGWQSDVQHQLGVELGVRIGAFSDFNTFTTYSWRTLGQAMGRLRISPTLTMRAGVAYIDRNDIKLLPVGGFLWTPNPRTRFDIFFPEPKLAQYMTTIGTRALWWYIGGEYGGGAWTIERDAGFSDRIDINDIRITLGFEWGQPNVMAQGRRDGFFEVGWVTSREVVFVTFPSETFQPRDSFMLRIGFGY